MSRDTQTEAHILQIVLVCGGAGFVIGFMALGILPAIIFALMFSGIGFGVYRVMAVGSGRLAGTLLVPDARGGHAPGYSHIEALEAKGDFVAALEAWERVVIETPDALAPRIHAADLHARKGKNPARAAELFRSVQAHPHAPDDTLRYVSQRLIDLLLGPLNDEGRALVELRKVADRWPGTPEGNGARAAIARIKTTRPS
jgi:hypothetical protein